MPTSAASKRTRRLLELAGICLAAALLGVALLPRLPLFIKWELSARDRAIALGHRESLEKDFVFLAIDESSLKLDQPWPEDFAASPALRAMQGGFPWPRSVYAGALDRLLGAGARLVIFDLIFDKPREGDAELKAALDRYRSQVLIGANYSKDLGDPANPYDDVPAITLPTTTLIEDPASDPRVGYVNFWPGSDEIVRQAIYSATLQQLAGNEPRPGESVYYSLAAAAMRQLGRKDSFLHSAESKFFRFGVTESVPTYPFYSIFMSSDWQRVFNGGKVFQNKIVMIGPGATRMQDFHNVPVGNGRMAGPLVHLNALSAALHQAFYEWAPNYVGLLLTCAAALLAFGLAWRFRRNPVSAFVSLALTTILYLLVIYCLANWANYLLQVLQPTTTFLLAGVTCIAWNFARERRESGRMRSMLERYVSRNLVREVLDHRDDFLSKLGGTRQPVTVLFSDVRGFTSFSEREDASAVVEQLNEYLGEMVGVIFRRHGTVDKFMGDGIMAVWGNVVSEGPAIDARHAVAAAWEMLERLDGLNTRWAERQLRPFAVGIGLHHGDAVFGNIGSAEKMEPTVIGDTVNLASRVEGLTKKYGVAFCITQPLAELVSEQFLLRTVDLVQVVGKSRPVEILTVVGPRATAEMPPWMMRYEGAVADFRARRFAEAAEALRVCVAEAPGDKLCALYLKRSESFLAEPPPEDWTGTEIATSK
jgi:adenylate cyclase